MEKTNLAGMYSVPGDIQYRQTSVPGTLERPVFPVHWRGHVWFRKGSWPRRISRRGTAPAQIAGNKHSLRTILGFELQWVEPGPVPFPCLPVSHWRRGPGPISRELQQTRVLT